MISKVIAPQISGVELDEDKHFDPVCDSPAFRDFREKVRTGHKG